jgi:predicted CXXCH cytochrome family protein
MILVLTGTQAIALWRAEFAAISPCRADEAVYQAVETATLSYDGPPAMLMPTDVAVHSDGRVFVVDGVNDRLVAFSAEGRFLRELRRLGDETLSHPVSLTIDTAGQLWIADAGNARVVIADADGGLIRVLPLPASPDKHPVDPTGLALTPDGRSLWVTDNDHHRLFRIDTSTGAATILGSPGEALGQFNYPYRLALDATGELYITDVLNGRVQRFTAQGRAAGAIGDYGVESGHLYRPKAVACDDRGDVWVTDGSLGVVQVFNRDGGYLDVVRGPDGKPLRLAFPMGLAFDANQAVYIVELEANRVRKFRLLRGARITAATPRARTAQIIGTQARSCTVCHLEWMEPLSKGVATALIAPPPNPPEQPFVSTSGSCLSCHDTSVVDSRRRVWREHGHLTGITPPMHMKIPPNLPLADGKIACRTCHSAHASGNMTADVKTAVFLRVPNHTGQLCISCHPDKTRGPKLGTHPTGGMPWPVPKALIEAGAKLGPNPRELTCVVCHTPHGSAHDHLLVMGVESNQLCLECHDQMRPGMFRDGSHAEHPLSPVVNAVQKAAVERLGTRLGPQDQLLCLSCHKLHHGKGERFMLADDLTDGRFCLSCHAEKTSVADTSHDLRKNFPQERNRLGMTPQSGGPCSACHMFHRYARSPEFSDLDPGGGKCITCHQSGRCAESKTLGAVNHPGAPGTACHDPHDAARAQYLRAEPKDLCTNCHRDAYGMLGGSHDIRVTGGKWPHDIRDAGDPCMTCHQPHGDKTFGLFRYLPAEGMTPMDGACVKCHPDASWHGQDQHAAQHPRSVPPGSAVDRKLLVEDESGARAAVGCRSCHNPHSADGKSTRFLRIEPGEPKSKVCLACHTANAAIALTGHGTASLRAAGLESADSCLPCHTPHAAMALVHDRWMWPKTLTKEASHAAHGLTSLEVCVTCHRTGGPAKPPQIAEHPEVPMWNVNDTTEKRTLPLYDGDGNIRPRGKIVCQTCHLPHGRWSDEAMVSLASVDLSRPQRRSLRLMLRPFTTPNLCTTCHGTDARRRFLYFHDPRRRGGPLN